MQAHIRSEAQRLGLTVEQYVERLKAQALKQHQEQQAQQQAQQQQQQQQQPVQPGPPKPEALALASFLKSQDLKPRTCIFNDQRKDMFKGTNCPFEILASY
jgi:translocation protein SEC62